MHSYFKFIFLIICLVTLSKAKSFKKHVKECKADSDCKPEFSCVHTERFNKKICAKKRDEPEDEKEEIISTTTTKGRL